MPCTPDLFGGRGPAKGAVLRDPDVRHVAMLVGPDVVVGAVEDPQPAIVGDCVEPTPRLPGGPRCNQGPELTVEGTPDIALIDQRRIGRLIRTADHPQATLVHK